MWWVGSRYGEMDDFYFLRGLHGPEEVTSSSGEKTLEPPSFENPVDGLSNCRLKNTTRLQYW